MINIVNSDKLNVNESTFISLERISKTYDGKTYVLSDLNFKLNRGEIAIITGPSGSGKSTFLNILGLLDDFTEGTYLFDGHKLKNTTFGDSLSRLRGDKIGFIFQSYYLIESLSVKDNILMPFLYSEKKIPENIIASIVEYADAFGISELLEKKASLLSGGERQRIAIIRAMIKKPELIIADEPTGNLDEANGEVVINAFRKIAESGTAVVMVTHNPNIHCPEGTRYCLNGGKLIESK